MRLRGAALATVLLASGVLLVVCMSLATVSVLDLNLAGSYAMRTQSLLMAQAAVTQLVTELDKAVDADQGSGTDLTVTSRVDLLERYKKPPFPSRADDFPGDVIITFDQGNSHYSVDNSDSDKPAAGWLDRGGGAKSVPPYAIDLIVGTRIGGRLSWFHAVLRRRWPYVLTTPGRVTMMGTPAMVEGHPGTVVPTTIAGNIFSLMDMEMTAGGPPKIKSEEFDFQKRGSVLPPNGDPEEPSTGTGYDSSSLPEPDQEDEIYVAEDMLKGTLQLIPKDVAYVNVGGQADAYVSNGGKLTHQYSITSTGNVVAGDVDIMSRDGVMGVNAYQAPLNIDDGGVRRGVDPGNIRKNLKTAFRIPDTGGWEEVDKQNGGDPSASPQPPRPTKEDGTPKDTNVPASSLIMNGIGPPKTKGDRFFTIYQDLVLQGPPKNGNFVYDSKGRFKIGSSAGNRYVEKMEDGSFQVKSTGAGIELHDCMLYVNGNLDLSSTAGDEKTLPALRGTNATIIVNGTLVLNNGSLTADADSEGMVIYCRRLVSEARGHYKGLIMVEKSAAFFPPAQGKSLEIEGAVVCGGSPVTLYGVSLDGPVSPSPAEPGGSPNGSKVDKNFTGKITGSVGIQGLHLWSTHLEYNASYLKTLNRFGPMTLMMLHPIE